MENKYNELNDKQKHVLLDSGTEMPYSGALLNEKDDGSYSCAQCNSKIFDSNAKFDSFCGWPSFDKAVEGSVKEIQDTSFGMIRTAIHCATCGGHLGHVFLDGPKETTGMRYCVNSVSLNFEDTEGNQKSGSK